MKCHASFNIVPCHFHAFRWKAQLVSCICVSLTICLGPIAHIHTLVYKWISLWPHHVRWLGTRARTCVHVTTPYTHTEHQIANTLNWVCVCSVVCCTYVLQSIGLNVFRYANHWAFNLELTGNRTHIYSVQTNISKSSNVRLICTLS